MRNIHEEDVIRRLERLGQLTPAADSTRQALDRVRRALADEPPAEASFSNRTPIFVRTCVAALLLCAVGLIFWLLPSPPAAQASLADVQAAMKAARSVTFRETTRGTGEPEKVTRSMILGGGPWRAEETDGSYTVTVPANHRSLFVNPQKKEAVLLRGVNLPQDNLYEWTKNVTNDAKARQLPAKRIDGKEVIGFVIQVDGGAWLGVHLPMELTVWADAKTRLPVRIETGETDAHGKKTQVVMDQFVFDQPLDPKLFSTEPPAGFKVVTQGTENFPDAPKDAALKKLIVTPLVGIGPVKFGMSREETERVFGKPDDVQPLGEGSSQLLYSSRGVFITASKKFGVVSISCAGQRGSLFRVRDFAGKTDKGIGLGASSAEIIRAYGKPESQDKDEGSTTLQYSRKLRCFFQLEGDKLVQMFFMWPRPTK